MAKAFLSHSSTDKNFVGKIYQQLGRNNCHYDTFTFEAGNKTLDEILSALDDSDIFVLFISDKALESPWIKNEMEEANKRLGKDIIRKIFPLIIDPKINYDDKRIPDWLQKPYNIHKLLNEVVVLQKIKQFLREVNLSNYKHNLELEELFVGRYDEMAQFERELIRIDNSKPACIVMTGVFEGIGRRTLLKNGLIKTRIIRKYEEPFFISLGNKESIENFILTLNSLDPQDEIFKKDLSVESLESKIEIAKDLLFTFSKNGIIVNILDEGSIVLPNHTITDWFVKIINDKRFLNQVTICLISRFKPRNISVTSIVKISHFNVPQLNKEDTKTLFVQYLDILKLRLTPENATFFLSHLSGIPAQTIHCVNLIDKLGLDLAKRNISDIDDFAELRVISVLENFKEDENAIQLLVLLSKSEVFTFDLLNKIFDSSENLYNAVDKLLNYSVFDLMGSSNELIRLNYSVSDYIKRSRLKLNEKFNSRFNNVVKDLLSNEIDLSKGSDYSEFLITIQEMVNQGKTIPKRYFIPSFMIKTIIQKYNRGEYQNAITLAKSALENDSRYDEQIIREIKYWLALSYARERDSKFYDIVKYFEYDFKDYNFLLGFNSRIQRDFDKAEEYYKKVLSRDPEHSRTKRELVLVYLGKGRYIDALGLAESNYRKFKTNVIHIQAYFTCLVKKKFLTDEEKQTLQRLINAASRSLDYKAKDIERTMRAEYEFYVDNNTAGGIKSMQEAIKLCNNKFYPSRALYEMYLKQGLKQPADKIASEYDMANVEELD